MTIQVLVTTMMQNDLSIYSKMNIRTDAIIANQANSENVRLESFGSHKAKMVTTNSRGLSKNRNIAIQHSFESDSIVLFCDDDLVLEDNYEEQILSEFEKHQYADAIKFNLRDLSLTRKISMARITKFEKATRKNMSSSGVCGLAMRRSVIQKYSLSFDERFGSGSPNYCGEDTIFLQNIINKRIKVYRSPIVVACIDQTNSTWFEGYTEKYFITCGKVFAVCYPHLCKLLAIRSSFKFSKNKKCSLSFSKILNSYFHGIKFFRKNKC